MKRVCVTGAAGTAGKAAVHELVEHGYEVIATDIVRPADTGYPVVRADLADAGEAFQALAGCEAVVHMAADPSPLGSVPLRVFSNNFNASLNVLEAAKTFGMQAVVLASSITVYGVPFTDEPPEYAPVDEEHPLRPRNTYALGKKLIEEASVDYARWTGMRVANLRLANIVKSDEQYAAWAGRQAEHDFRLGSLWTYVDRRDVAQACRLAVEKAPPGASFYNIVAADTAKSEPAPTLLARHYPDAKMNATSDPNQSMISIDKARRELGYAPAYSWRTCR